MCHDYSVEFGAVTWPSRVTSPAWIGLLLKDESFPVKGIIPFGPRSQ